MMRRTKSPSPPPGFIPPEGQASDAPEKHPWGLPSIGIPAEVLFHPELTHVEKILFGFIRNLSKTEKGCWASNRWLGGLVGVGPQTASNAVKKLAQWKFVNATYSKLPDGRRVRRMWVNPAYPQIYEQMTVEGYKNIYRGLLEKLYTPIREFIDPYYETYNKEDIKEDRRINTLSGQAAECEREEGKKQSAQERSSEFLPLASKLRSIVQQKKNIKVSPTMLKAWANEIRILVETNEVSPQRVEAVLDWYKTSIGGTYIPVVESGRSLRDKFTRLEDAMKKETSLATTGQDQRQSSHPTVAAVSPRRLIHKHFKNRLLSAHFYEQCFLPAEALLVHSSPNSTVDKVRLAKQLISLHVQIAEQQAKHLSEALSSLLPGPMDLVKKYITWIENSRWISNHSTNMFDTAHTLFGRFRREEASCDTVERDPLTGRSYLRG